MLYRKLKQYWTFHHPIGLSKWNLRRHDYSDTGRSCKRRLIDWPRRALVPVLLPNVRRRRKLAEGRRVPRILELKSCMPELWRAPPDTSGPHSLRTWRLLQLTGQSESGRYIAATSGRSERIPPDRTQDCPETKPRAHAGTDHPSHGLGRTRWLRPGLDYQLLALNAHQPQGICQPGPHVGRSSISRGLQALETSLHIRGQPGSCATPLSSAPLLCGCLITTVVLDFCRVAR